jgi:curved DNA-binding protein CbpA
MLINDYYFKLGLSPGEPAERIRQVFRQQVKLYYPERLGSGRLRLFQELVRADHTLSNPERRRDYDRALSETETGGDAKALPPWPLAGARRDRSS